jgi:hypothetical protein
VPKSPDSLLEATLLAAVAAAGPDATVDAVAYRLGEPMARRTLQRRLAALVAAGRLHVTGRARATRYHVPATATKNVQIGSERNAGPGGASSAERYVPVSDEAQRLKDAVRADLHLRRPVGYRAEFLDGYRPNSSFYLPQPLRERLAAMGRDAAIEAPAGTYARKLLDRLLIDLSWNSSRLEGNTYSLLDTQRLIEHGDAAEGKNAAEAQMILNHKAAIEFLVDGAGELGFNRYTITNLHALLADNLLADPRAGGRLRTSAVAISGTTFIPLANPQRIDEEFTRVLAKAEQIADPLEQAFFAMVHLPYLQPFDDVNKRVSRLAANLPLIQRNLCPLSFVDVPQQAYVDGLIAVYETNGVALLRDVFAWAYERSCARYGAVRQSLGEPDALRLRYRDVMRELVAAVVRQAMNSRQAAAYIDAHIADAVAADDRARCIELVHAELIALHEGSIARYRLRPGEYHAWKAQWR